MDGETADNTRILAIGETARANFLHWAWQIKFEAAKNVAHVVDKMLHACGGSGYKRDMELERYLRDGKAGWVMGPTNEVLRQFVGKAVLLGFESLDYWNQTYNRRAVENEVKKLDRRASASSPSSWSRRRRSRRPRSPRRRGRVRVATARDRGCSSRVSSRTTRPARRTASRRAATTILSLEPGDRLTVRDVHGGQRALLVSDELGRSRRGPLRARVTGGSRGDVRCAPGGCRLGHAHRRACRWWKAASPPPTCASRSGARNRARSSTRRYPIRSPSRGSTSRSRALPLSPTRCRRASTSR